MSRPARRPLAVVALGGNALLRRGEPLSAANQEANVAMAVDALADLAATHRLVITHGNGPQVGLLALQAAAYQEVSPYPLDVLGAESEGMIGYLLDQHLHNALPDRQVATLLTEVEVDENDPAFRRPTKPIGPLYDEATARQLSATRGWLFDHDGRRWRRVVASPAPCAILELHTIRLLVDADVIVVCAGGGGIPVVRYNGGYAGVEAVIDKDATAAVLAEALEADTLLLLTDVDGVYRNWGTPDAELIRHATPADLDPNVFESGSMRPKVAAACRFASHTGRPAVIGALGDAAGLVNDRTGTRIGYR